MKHHSKAVPVWLHGARLLFPPAATLLFLVLTEWIARGTLNADTFLQYISPHAEAYLLAWGLLFLVWLALDWLTRFAPLARCCQPCWAVCPLRWISTPFSCGVSRSFRGTWHRCPRRQVWPPLQASMSRPA